MKIALYVGNEVYPAPSSATLAQLTGGRRLTTPILALLNEKDNKLIYNDSGNYLYDADGKYVGDPAFINICNTLRIAGMQEVLISFSTSGTEFLARISSDARTRILTDLKEKFRVDAVDFDYEGSDFSSGGPLYTATDAAVAVGLDLTAAPYMLSIDWAAWVTHVQAKGGIVRWLNLQCYDGGAGNDPNQTQWNSIPAPILGGCWEQQSPSAVQTVVSGWLAESNKLNPPPPGPFAGGFFWVYSSIQSQYDAYMNAMATGLGM